MYRLIDPRDGSVFYVGKGSGKRILQHEADAARGRIGNVAKHERILAIWAAGLQVEREMVAEGLTESQAFDLERQLIGDRAGLANIQPGGMSARDRNAMRARCLLGLMVPYEAWLAGPHPEPVDDYPGGPRALYDAFAAVLTDIAENGWVGTLASRAK